MEKYGEPILIQRAILGWGSYEYYSFPQPLQGALDEFRIYKRCLTKMEAAINFNSGTGNNPSETEHLVCWFQFEEFETLDFSSEQNGSNMQLGIRDMSGNNNHLLPVGGIITDANAPGYVLQRF